MSRIDRQFAAALANDRKLLIPFITAGDPSLDSTVPVMHALVRAGADLIELGVPFSDPMADGPSIQHSSERAIERGAGLRFALECVQQFRRQDSVTPVVLMGYLNPVDILGAAEYARRAVAAGVDGTLLVDLPDEEAGPFRDAFAQSGLEWIGLVAPTTSIERLQAICQHAEGYLYYVSYAGVTGTGQALQNESNSGVLARLQEQSPVPVVVGFGVRDAESAKRVAADADGVVIGSALVDTLSAADDPVLAAEAFLRPVREALDGLR